MATILFVLMLLSITHFVIESVIVPSARIELRYKLHAIRDNFRKLKFDNDVLINDATFQKLDYAFSKSIRMVPQINLKMLYNLIISRQLIESNDNDYFINLPVEVKTLMLKNLEYVFKAFLVNSLGWIIYLMPIIVIYLILRSITKWSIGLKDYLLQIILSSENFASSEEMLLANI